MKFFTAENDNIKGELSKSSPLILSLQSRLSIRNCSEWVLNFTKSKLKKYYKHLIT